MFCRLGWSVWGAEGLTRTWVLRGEEVKEGPEVTLSLKLFAMIWSHFLPSPSISRSPDEPTDRP